MVIGQRYTLKRQIGQGGMGAVWLAVDEVLGREVAVKRVGLFPGGSSPDLLRAQREAKLAARLNHPHVVSVFDFVTEGQEQWLVMEYVAGTNLSALADKQGGLSPPDAAALLGQTAEALAAAHSAGIVHRDVKPSNILVTDDGTAKLADFGIARARADSTLTRSGMVSGSPAYLAPEVASGHPATEASDVWSLGATLFHTLTGRPPYDAGDNVLAAMYQIVHEAPPRLTDAGWPAGLLETTMTTDPEQRWPMSRVREYLASAPSWTEEPGVSEVTPTSLLPESSSTAHTSVPPPGQATHPRTVPVAGPVMHPEKEPAYDPGDTGDIPPRDGDRRPTWLLPILLGFAVLLIGAAVGWGLLQPDPSPTAADRPAETASSSPSRTPSSAPSASPSPEQSSPPTETPSPSQPSPPSDSATEESPGGGAGEGQIGEMRSFVQAYVATALTDPETSWEQLTPRFQQDCCNGNVGSYAGFWGTIATATLRDIKPNPETMEVSYIITWDPEGERGKEDELVTLGLVEADGRYLIDYEV
jgi:eukaryotic-like serine/threonine-protein kinase